MVIRPADYPTVTALRDAIRAGIVSRFDGVISQVRVDGQPAAIDIGEFVVDSEPLISYDIVIYDTNEDFPPEVLTNVKPENRPIYNGRLRSSAVGDPITIMRYGDDALVPRVYRVLHATERPGWVSCQGQPLEA